MPDATLVAVPSAPTAAEPTRPVEAPPPPIQVMLPAELKDVIESWPDVKKRLAALEAKPAIPAPANTALVAAFACLCGASGMAVGVWLWFYAAVLFRF